MVPCKTQWDSAKITDDFTGRDGLRKDALRQEPRKDAVCEWGMSVGRLLAIETVKAGVDIVLLPADYTKAVDGIIKAVDNGTLDEKKIDESVYRILSLKKKKGLLDN